MLRWPNAKRAAERADPAPPLEATGDLAKPVLISRPAAHQKAVVLGAEDYGYAIVADRFAALFPERGIPVREIAAPEQAKDPLFYTLAGLTDGAYLHLIFRPAEQIRPMAGAYNVAWFSWPFERLRDETLPHELVVQDQVRMLRTCDEVWVPCAFTQRVLAAHGIEHVHIVPAPIPTAGAPSTAGLGDLAYREAIPLVSLSTVDEPSFHHIVKQHVTTPADHAPLGRAVAAGRLFLTVVDPMNPRKNLPALLDGFIAATRDVDDALLLVKLVGSGAMQEPFNYLFHHIRATLKVPHCLREDRVLLMAGTLTEAEMAQLYGVADFYLCAAVAEGQNLPLLEAMGAGCVPVTVTNTAMADYVTPDNAVEISGRRFTGLVTAVDGNRVRGRLAVDHADPYQIADGVRRALSLDADARAAKATAARGAVQESYADAAVMARLTQRLNAVRPDVTPMPARLRRSWWR